jgi:hypothetical protein
MKIQSEEMFPRELAQALVETPIWYLPLGVLNDIVSCRRPCASLNGVASGEGVNHTPLTVARKPAIWANLTNPGGCGKMRP